MKTTNEISILYSRRSCCRSLVPFIRTRFATIFKCLLSGLALYACAMLTPESWAVDIRMVGQPVRVTVSVNSSGSAVIPTAVTVTTNGLSTLDGTGTNWVCSPVNLGVTCPANPSGLSFTLTDPNTNVITSFTPVISTNQGSITTNVLLWVNTTNVPSGAYGFSLNASGPGTGILLLSVQSAHIWSGAGGTGNPAWTSSVNWVGGNVPGAGAEVVVNDAGGLITSATNATVRISANTTIGSLRYTTTNAPTVRHNFMLDPGVTLRITNAEGYKVSYRDRSDNYQSWFLTFTGPQSVVVVSNPSANVSWFSYNNQTSTNYMDQLGAFVANVHQFSISDYAAYPDVTNLQANNYADTALPRNMPCGEIKFARTNAIVCSFSGDADGWTNPAFRSYSMVVGRNMANLGTTQRRNVSLGISNYFALNSILFTGFGVSMDQTGGQMQFNTNFTAIYGNSNCFAVFRGANGTDRVTMFTLADYATPGVGSSSAKNIIDFTGGTIDAFVDRLWIARDRTNASGDYARGDLRLGRGIFDVNDVILGYQANGTNLGSAENYCQANLRVSNGGLFRARNAIDLGYTTAEPGGTNGTPAASYGKIFVSGGATLSASEIRVGGVTKISWDNTISVSGGGSTLIVSNTIAAPDKMLSSLSIGSGSRLTLHLNGTNAGHYVYATNLTVSAGSTLNIASAVGLDVPPEGTNVPIFMFASGGAGNFTVTMPSPMRGAIVPGNSPNENDLLIITNEPRNLVWRGLTNNNWDNTTSNWIDSATLQPARFITGDNVLFDDATLPSTTISISAPIVAGVITVSNENNSFVLANGGSSILGGSLTKEGSGSLAIDGSASIPVEVNGGKLVGLGSVGSVTVASGAELDFSGTISPSGLTCYGIATLRGSTIGTITVQTGGVVTNAATGTTQGAISTRSGSLLYNAGHLGNGGVGIGSSTIVSNATFINAGNIGLSGVNSTLAVSGIFKEMGVVGKDIYLTLLDINAGTGTNNNNAGTFIPGGDGIGVTTIKSPGIAGVSFSGRVRLGVGSTNIFKVDPATTNTVLQATWIDYGPSIGVPTFIGGFIWVTNVGVTPFAAGQRFGLFKYEDGTLPIQFGSTNSYPLMIPAVPGPALAWDLSDVKMNGNVGIRSYSTTPTNIALVSSTFTLVTNLTSTNRGIVLNLQWPGSHIGGWHVEEQTSTRQQGMLMGATNWTPVFASYFTNQIPVTNVVGSSNIGFYRLVSP